MAKKLAEYKVSRVSRVWKMDEKIHDENMEENNLKEQQ